jgi:hypothetical protein
MHDDVLEDAISEDAPTLPVGVISGPVDAVRQFNDANRRQRDVDLATQGTNPAQDVLDRLPRRSLSIRMPVSKISPTG